MRVVVDHISATKAAADAIKMTAQFLVGKLATGSPDYSTFQFSTTIRY